MSELKPCPFCGPGNSVVSYYQDPYDYHIVGCGRCGSHSGTRPPSDPEGRQKVIASWNSRPMEDLPRTVQAAPSDREKRLEAAIRCSEDNINEAQKRANCALEQVARTVRDISVARAALADTTTGEVQP